MPSLPGGLQPLKDEAFDVAIVGAGITGMSLALLLQQQGKKCVVLEAQQRGFGTTGGTTAHLNTLMDHPYSKIIKDFGADAARMVHSVAEEAIGLIEYQIMQYRIDCGFRRTDAFLLAENEAEEKELETIRTSCAEAGLDAFYTKETGAPFLYSRALKVPRQACFHPLQYLAGISDAYTSLGGIIYEQARVWEAEHQEDIYRVQTSRGTLSAQHVVYATHIPTGINLLHLRCMPWRSYVLAAALEGDYPEGLYYDMKDPYYRSQQVNGKSYLVAGGKDHRTGSGDNTAWHFTTLEAELRRHFRVARITERWSSQYYESADGIPYIGHLPGAPERSWVATGFGGNGMTYSQVAARLLADEICGKQHPAHDLFSPGRVKVVAGFKNFVQHNAHVAAEVISRFFRSHEETELASLAPGEARVLSVEGHTVAVHKDDAGKVHAVHAHCSHMGCDLKWNQAELSWDCPCHGARFNADGQVLNAPASAALQEIPLFSNSTPGTSK
jgi:glycine/D-amino acid oxidase-like deaminating enzyme/nitrite reductase/ring-hydroxylating ferredoxin subunit